jgi:hypothetical protein
MVNLVKRSSGRRHTLATRNIDACSIQTHGFTVFVKNPDL